MTSPVLQVRDLALASHRGHVVSDVGFRLHRGRSLGIIGESGSGKTLTLRALMGLLPTGVSMTGGVVEADLAGTGTLEPVDPRTLRGRGLSMAFQDPLAALDPTMRVGAFVAEVLGRARGGSRRAMRAAAREALTEVGFDDPSRIAASFPHQLSNGQRQRVVLAIALASDPVVLLCDEVTSALDVTTQAQIIDLLGDLRRRRGLSIVFVTHDLAVAREMVDDLVVMRAGLVVETGPVQTVLADPRQPYTRTLIEAFSTGRVVAS